MIDSIHIFQAMILGVVQGITEFLPVSSSGHLILARHYFNMPEVPLLFDVFLHVATLIVVCFFYRSTIVSMSIALIHFITRKMSDEDKTYLRYFLTIIGATLITIVVALILRKVMPEGENVIFVAIMMLFTALILLYRPNKEKKLNDDFSQLRLRHSIITGLAQGFGTLPGISRSGITISSALYSGMKREVAGEFAFVLSIPAILGALVLASFDYASTPVTISLMPLLFGSLVAAITGFFSLKMLLWMIGKARLWIFSIYLLLLSITILITSL
ncbi:MAG: undecaprenyl-diphosphate phosphatase [Spirochaetia bacterium]|nr:undecaprenyl-diphosphate phosphatase [Spirochaetia bacterium]